MSDNNNNNDNNNNEVESSNNVDAIGEFSKKFASTEDKINSLYESQQQIINALNNLYSKPSNQKENNVSYNNEEEDAELSNLLLTNPAKALKIIEKRAAEKAKMEIEGSISSKEKRSQILNGLIQKYPELSNTNSDLTQLATKIYASYDESDRNSSLAYRTAVEDAAERLGIQPKNSKIQQNQDPGDGQVLSSSRTQENSSKYPKKPSKDMLEVAKMMGYDINNKEHINRITNFLNKQNQ